MDILTTAQYTALAAPTPEQTAAWQRHLRESYLSEQIINADDAHGALVNVVVPMKLGLSPLGFRSEPVTIEAYELTYADQAEALFDYAQKIGAVAA